jgi:beta-glucosidase-like glycosyl hydrolase
VIATVKHFINNNQDYHRYDIDEVLDERTMMELYMPTFLGAVEAGVGAAMCGYNKVNGLHACEQPQTLLTFKKLGFSGWMMSDWCDISLVLLFFRIVICVSHLDYVIRGGTHSTSINQGLDMEMPDGVYMGAPLAAAVAAGFDFATLFSLCICAECVLLFVHFRQCDSGQSQRQCSAHSDTDVCDGTIRQTEPQQGRCQRDQRRTQSRRS